MDWSIDYYSEKVRLEIEALPVGIRAAYARLAGLLMEFGLALRMPHTRAMGDGLFECRTRGQWVMVSLSYGHVGRKGLPG